MPKRHPIIALTGAAGSGKDTVADFLCDRYGYTKLAFADALRIEICRAFGVHMDRLTNRETKETPCRVFNLSRCNDHRFVGLILASELNMAEAGEEAIEAAMNQPRSPRWIMQQWGTEYRRKEFGDDYWMTEMLLCLSYIQGPVVITDCRFANEADFVTQLGGEIWQLHRQDLLPVTPHCSETPIPRHFVDRDLDNRGDISNLYKQAEHALMMMDRARRRAIA